MANSEIIVYKFFVEFDYIRNDNTTFKYENDCLKLLTNIKTGTGCYFILTSNTDNIDTLKTLLYNEIRLFFDKYQLLYNTDVILTNSFNINVKQLNGINTLCNVIVNTYLQDETVDIFNGNLNELSIIL